MKYKPYDMVSQHPGHKSCCKTSFVLLTRWMFLCYPQAKPHRGPQVDSERAGRIYREQRGFMFAIAHQRLGNRDDAEDAVQDAAILLLRQRTEPEDERGLAYTMIRYSVSALFDKRHVNKKYFTQMDLVGKDYIHPRQIVPSAERAAIARMLVSTLASTAPTAVLLSGSGHTMTEITGLLGINYQTLWAQVAAWRRTNRSEYL